MPQTPPDAVGTESAVVVIVLGGVALIEGATGAVQPVGVGKGSLGFSITVSCDEVDELAAPESRFKAMAKIPACNTSE